MCHKIYLGDRKMKKHVKLFPNHGPTPESLYQAQQLQQAVPISSSAGPLAPPPPPPPSMVSITDDDFMSYLVKILAMY